MTFGSPSALERYVPVPPAETYAALVKVAASRFNLKKTDDFTRTCHFTSGMSEFTWGEKFIAQVVPSEGGATVKVSGVGKIGGQLLQHYRNAKLMNLLLDDVVDLLRPAS